ncbi:MAG: hypothetical protein HC788_08870 [Sphingopyxis sp.]|nr:hypothetical protein [Sphingopyxis sp.]
MARRSLYQRLRQNAVVRLCLFGFGAFMLLLVPIIGVLPGPGGIVLFPIGLALVLQNSVWAKRVYGRFKRKHPRYAAWADRLMRRPTAARKRALEKLEGEALREAKEGN